MNRAIGVEILGVSKMFGGEVSALSGVSLSVGAGEFVAILGPSGCGKSTLLRIVAGLEGASAGKVNVERGRGGIAYVFQDAHLLPWRNVARNVGLPLELMGVGKRERELRAMDALGRVGLGEWGKKYPGQLSGGMKMRVSLARALVTRPKLLLMDEPFAALDEITRQQLDEQLRGLWRGEGMTVLFVTHSTGEAAFLADRAVVMSKRPGRVMADLKMELPEERTGGLRGEAVFAAAQRGIFEALERGMA